MCAARYPCVDAARLEGLEELMDKRVPACPHCAAAVRVRDAQGLLYVLLISACVLFLHEEVIFVSIYL